MEIQNENICRMCLTQADILSDIFDSRHEIKTPHKIYACTNLQVKVGDGYPSLICNSCKSKLNDAFQFRTDCIQSYKILNSSQSNIVKNKRIDGRQYCSNKSKLAWQNEIKNSKNKLETNIHSRRSKKAIVGHLKRGLPKEDIKLSVKRTSNKRRDKLKTQKIRKILSDIPNEKCNVCGKIFKSIGYLSHHMRVHTGLKPYHCKVCRKTFSQNSALIVHSRGHSGDKPYICNLCGKGFTQSGNLAVHYRSHTGERPFQCDICAKSFTQVGNLYIHKRIHTGERQYECEICDKAFKFPSHLAEHARIHSMKKQYQCSICDKGFHKRSYLSTHMRIHTGEKPYKCEHCGKSFSNSSNLVAHKRIHTGSKPYVCTECGKGFTQSSALVRHVKQHTKTVVKNEKKIIKPDKLKNIREIKLEISTDNHKPTVIISEKSHSIVTNTLHNTQTDVVFTTDYVQPETIVIKENKQSRNQQKSGINNVVIQNINILKKHHVRDVPLIRNYPESSVQVIDKNQNEESKIARNIERTSTVIDIAPHLLTFQPVNDNSKVSAYKLYQIESNTDNNGTLLYDTVSGLPYEIENAYSVFKSKKIDNVKSDSMQIDDNWKTIEYVSRNPFYVEYQSVDEEGAEGNIRLPCDYQSTSSVNDAVMTYELTSPDLKGNEVNVINFVQSSDHLNAGRSDSYN